MICKKDLSVEKVLFKIREILDEDEEEGMRPKELSE